jgi:hypothetical protein
VTIVTIYVDTAEQIALDPAIAGDTYTRVDLGHNTFLTLSPEARVRLGQILAEATT